MSQLSAGLLRKTTKYLSFVNNSFHAFFRKELFDEIIV